MKGLLLALLLTTSFAQTKTQLEAEEKKVIVGLWKLDQNVGMAKKAAEYKMPLDWVIEFKEDGTLKWTVYEPFVEGVGRRYRESKGTYVLNLKENLLAIKREMMGQRFAFQGILSENRTSFTIPGKDPKREDQQLRFIKAGTKQPPSDGG